MNETLQGIFALALIPLGLYCLGKGLQGMVERGIHNLGDELERQLKARSAKEHEADRLWKAKQGK